MADKVSFTNFGERKKVRKVKRRGPKKPNINAEELLDEVLAAKKVADRTIAESGSNLITLPFLEFSALQEAPFIPGEWNPIEITRILENHRIYNIQKSWSSNSFENPRPPILSS